MINTSYNTKDKLFYGYIYIITNDINDKIYIGQTRRTIELRWKEHQNSTKYEHDNSILYRAMNKYGIKHFSISLLKQYSHSSEKSLQEILNNEEIKYIQKYNSLIPNGYNLSKGGTYNSETRKKPIDQYDLKGNFIASYESIYSATQNLTLDNITYSHISECCQGKLKTAYGFVWRFKGEHFNKYTTTGENIVPIAQYDLSGNLLQVFDSVIEASIAIGKNKADTANICACCYGKYHTAYGYVWRQLNDPFDKYSLEHKKKKGSRVYQLDKDTKEIIYIYDSIHELTQKFDICKSTMCRKCKSHKLYKDSYWYYEDDYINLMEKKEN